MPRKRASLCPDVGEGEPRCGAEVEGQVMSEGKTGVRLRKVPYVTLRRLEFKL